MGHTGNTRELSRHGKDALQASARGQLGFALGRSAHSALHSAMPCGDATRLILEAQFAASAAVGTCAKAQHEVLAAEQQRAAAWIAGDTARLAAYLDDELVYIHATGVRHNREQLLEYLSTGPRFEGMGFQPRSFRLDGDFALLSGALHLRVAARPDRARWRVEPIALC